MCKWYLMRPTKCENFVIQNVWNVRLRDAGCESIWKLQSNHEYEEWQHKCFKNPVENWARHNAKNEIKWKGKRKYR